MSHLDLWKGFWWQLVSHSKSPYNFKIRIRLKLMQNGYKQVLCTNLPKTNELIAKMSIIVTIVYI